MQLQDLTLPVLCGEDGLQHQLRYIPAGLFKMGAAADDQEAFDVEKPRHSVAISAPFWMGAAPVTQRLYAEVMKTNPSRYTILSCPVDNVRWIDALIFCNRLSRREGLSPCYPIDEKLEKKLLLLQSAEDPLLRSLLEQHPHDHADGYRLPTEAEWEYAARSNQDSLYSGGDELSDVGWYYDNSAEQSHPVCQKAPNAFGLYDMSGNVWEWCWDSWDEQPYSNDSAALIHNSLCQNVGVKRITRGGSWYDSPQSSRITHRLAGDVLYRDPGQGFRVVRTVCG